MYACGAEYCIAVCTAHVCMCVCNECDSFGCLFRVSMYTSEKAFSTKSRICFLHSLQHATNDIFSCKFSQLMFQIMYFFSFHSYFSHLFAALALRALHIHTYTYVRTLYNLFYSRTLYRCESLLVSVCLCVNVCASWSIFEAKSEKKQRTGKKTREKNTHSHNTHRILAKRTKRVSIVVNVSHSTNYVCVCCCTQKRIFFSLVFFWCVCSLLIWN